MGTKEKGRVPRPEGAEELRFKPPPNPYWETVCRPTWSVEIWADKTAKEAHNESGPRLTLHAEPTASGQLRIRHGFDGPGGGLVLSREQAIAVRKLLNKMLPPGRD